MAPPKQYSAFGCSLEQAIANNLAVGDVLEVKFFTNNAVQQCINVLHYQVFTIAGGAMTDVQLVGAMSTTVSALYRGFMSSQASYAGARLQRLSPGILTAAVTSINGAGVGTIGGDMLPPQTSFLVQKRTSFAGRTHRGRVYLGFFSETNNSAAGLPDATAQTNAGLWAGQTLTQQAYIVGGVTTTLTPVIRNRVTGAIQGVEAIVNRTQWATQRRRSMINRSDVLGP